MLRFLLCLLLVLGLTSTSYSQNGKTNPANAPKLDQKKMAKANTMIAQAMKEKDKGKQGELINNALELYRDMKMLKEGNIAVGDAFYNKGDLKKGYDRLTGGLAITGFAGYLYLSENKLANFYAGFEYNQGFTNGLRGYQYDKMSSDNLKRNDIQIGFRAGWILPLYKRLKEFYVN
jgi:hypothetical protein